MVAPSSIARWHIATCEHSNCIISAFVMAQVVVVVVVADVVVVYLLVWPAGAH